MYSITVRRMTSGELLKYRKGLRIARSYETPFPGSSQFALTTPLQPMYLDRRGEVPEGWKPYYPLPVFSRHEGRLIVCFVRRFVESAQRFPELPRLSQAQWDALDMLRDLAASPEFSLDITFDPGDIQFVNNLTTMHSRTGYEDFSQPERKRHLLRLWLAVPGGWPLPQTVYDRYGATTPGGRPTGIVVTDPREPAPMDVA